MTSKLKVKIDKPFAGDEGYHVLISRRGNHHTSAGCMSLEDIEELRDQLSEFLSSEAMRMTLAKHCQKCLNNKRSNES